jgi:DNA-binding NarL/FixJ family response regulator
MSKKIKILIADDHQIIIDGVKSMLENHPVYEVVQEAANGQAAMDLISTAPDNYDLLIADINMPLLTGTELCKIIKHNFPDKKVLILSMYGSSPMVKEAILAEADGYILKNAGKNELLTALHKICNNGTFYSDEILPIILGQIEKEKKAKENTIVLTDREREILKYIVKEYTRDEIAEKLFISPKTVDNHRVNILQKTDCKSTIGLVKYALQNGIE